MNIVVLKLNVTLIIDVIKYMFCTGFRGRYMHIDTLQMMLNQMATAIELYPTNSLWIKAIPAVISVFNELIMFCDAREVEERLSNLEAKVEDLEIDHEEFVYSVKELNYHDKYAFRNFLKSYCLETLPEVTDAMIYALIDFAMDQKSGIREEVCEILRQFNTIDIECMRKIKVIVNTEEITRQREQEAISANKDNQSNKWGGHIFYYPGRTVVWSDFVRIKKLTIREEAASKEWIPNVSELMIMNFIKDDDEEVILSQEPRSIIKLQNLGVLTVYNNILVSASPMFNIDRFILTNYGMKILEYIK